MSKEETMVERVARAIYEKRNGAGATPWSRRSAAHKDPYLDDASAALDALMEPTDAMYHACWQNHHPWGRNAPPVVDRAAMFDAMKANVLADWRAMLSKAKEQGK